MLMDMNECLNESVACTTYECNVQNILVNSESNLSQYTKKCLCLLLKHNINLIISV